MNTKTQTEAAARDCGMAHAKVRPTITRRKERDIGVPPATDEEVQAALKRLAAKHGTTPEAEAKRVRESMRRAVRRPAKLREVVFE